MNTLPFTIHLPVYEGAIDLLLYIVRQRQLDLAELPLAIIANDFLIYARTVKNLDLDDAGEIIFVAALLLSMKARSLLPGEEEDEAVEEEVDRELSEALEEVYREIVVAAQQLARNEAAQRKHFPRGAAAETVPFDENIEFLKDVNLIHLAEAFHELTRNMARKNVRQISLLKVTIEDQAALLLELLKKRKSVLFRKLIETFADRIEAVVAFLALLQLIRKGQIAVRQKEILGEIYIFRGPQFELEAQKQLNFEQIE